MSIRAVQICTPMVTSHLLFNVSTGNLCWLFLCLSHVSLSFHQYDDRSPFQYLSWLRHLFVLPQASGARRELFSHSMRTLRIALSDPTKACFTCGDLVSGNVVLTSTIDEPIASIQVAFRGRTKSKIIHRFSDSPDSIYRGRATLFEFNQIIYRGQHTFEANTNEWPFVFTFPSVTLEDLGGKQWENSDVFAHLPGHTLPPTFFEASRPRGDCIEAYICYELEAILSRPASFTLFKTGSMTEIEVLRFSPFRLADNPDPNLYPVLTTFGCQTHLLDPDLPAGSLSLKNRVRVLWNHHRQPISIFTLKAELPQRGYVGGPLRVFVGVEHDLVRSTALVLPMIYLKRLQVKLVAISDVRCDRFSIFGASEKIESHNKTLDILDYGFSRTPVSERMNVSELVPRELVPRLVLEGPLVSTFTTYNIARSYRLDVKITVECAEKTFKAVFGGRPFLIMPGITKPDDNVVVQEQQATVGTDMVAQPGDVDDMNEALPPYERVFRTREQSLPLYG